MSENFFHPMLPTVLRHISFIRYYQKFCNTLKFLSLDATESFATHYYFFHPMLSKVLRQFLSPDAVDSFSRRFYQPMLAKVFWAHFFHPTLPKVFIRRFCQLMLASICGHISVIRCYRKFSEAFLSTDASKRFVGTFLSSDVTESLADTFLCTEVTRHSAVSSVRHTASTLLRFWHSPVSSLTAC